MSHSHKSLDPQELLKHGPWMRTLAQSLVLDPFSAEDVVQQTYMRAMERPPADTRCARSWLRKILKNVVYKRWRDERNRRRREQVVARAERTAATPEQAVERAELQQLVVDLVLGLQDPYRSTILLHYFEGMQAKEIATQERVDVSTVRRRLRHALELLRHRLDRRYGGSRKKWSVALVPLLPSHRSAEAILAQTPMASAAAAALKGLGGFLVMKKILVTAAIVSVAILGLWVTTHQSALDSADERSAEVAGPSANTDQPAQQRTVIGSEAGSSAEARLPAGTVAGRVYGEESLAGIPLVVLEIAPTEGTRRVPQEATDATGRYRFNNLLAGRYEIRCLKTPEGYQYPTKYDKALTISVNEGEHRVGVDIAVAKEIPLRGKVVTQDGSPSRQPAAGAQVVLVGGPDFSELRRAVSGEDGSFFFHGLGPLDTFHIEAEKDGYRTRTQDLALSVDRRNDFTLVLDSGTDAAHVAGTVIDLDGRPVADMLVLAQRAAPRSWSVLFDGHDKTDAEGRFEMKLFPGGYNIVFSPHNVSVRGYQGTRLELEPGEEVSGLELVYDRVFTISGVVYDPNGDPIAGAHVQLHNGYGLNLYDDETNSNGEYEIDGLGEDRTYNIEVTAKDFARAKVYGVEAASEGVDFVLTPSAYEIVGRMLDSETGQPLTDFELCWQTWWEPRGTPRLYSGNIYEFKSFSTTDGRFRLNVQLNPKRKIQALLLARAADYSTAIEAVDADSLGRDEEVVVYLEPGGRLSGMVIDKSGEPVPEVEIFYEHLARRKNHDWLVARTDAGGHFTIEHFPQSRQRVAFYHPDYADRLIDIPKPSDRFEPIEVVLTPGGTVKGSVHPMPKGELPWISVSDETWNLNRQKVDENGSFLIEHVRPQKGEATLEIDYNNYAEPESFFPFRYCTVQKQVTVEEGKTTEVRFTLSERTSVIEGQIDVANDLLPEYIQVQAVFKASQQTETHTVHANPDGSYRLDLLPAGKAELQVTIFEQSGVRHGTENKLLDIGVGQTLLRDFYISE